MDDSKKKPLLIGIVVVCLVLAVGVTLMRSPDSGGIKDIKSGEMIWMKCQNPECNAEYQMDKKDYFEYIMQNPKSGGAVVCDKCGQESAYKAIKCNKCGKVFIGVPNTKGYFDKCPDCGYSEMEEQSKK
jgi:hypothetical protein